MDDEDEEHGSKGVNRGRRTDGKKRSLEHVDDSDDSEDEDNEEDDDQDDSEDDDPSFDGRTIKETKRKSPSSANSKSTLQSSKSPRRGVLKPTVTTTNERHQHRPLMPSRRKMHVHRYTRNNANPVELPLPQKEHFQRILKMHLWPSWYRKWRYLI